MVILPPRPFLVGAANLAIAAPRQYFMRALPSGAWWRLKYVLINYSRTVIDGQQDSPDLFYQLYDADGRAFHVIPTFLPQVTSPAGSPGLDATNPINIDYPGGSTVKLEISGQLTLSGPATVSITLYGMLGWGGYGK